MSEHTVSHADKLFYSKAYKAGHRSGKRGIQMMPLYKQEWTDLATADVDGVCQAQTTGAAADLTINGALASGGVATFDYPRAVVIDSTGAGDTSQTATITGTDAYGDTLVEDIDFNGTTAVNGKKAFKTITNVHVDAALAGNATVGSTDILGLDYKLASARDCLVFYAATTEELASATVVAAVTTSPATATTGDVRGTITPNTAADGSKDFALWYMPDVEDSGETGVFGVAQYGG